MLPGRVGNRNLRDDTLEVCYDIRLARDLLRELIRISRVRRHVSSIDCKLLELIAFVCHSLKVYKRTIRYGFTRFEDLILTTYITGCLDLTALNRIS